MSETTTMPRERREAIAARTAAATIELFPIPGIPEYQVDRDGHVWSVFHRWRNIERRRMTPTIDRSGYPRVRLRTGGRCVKMPVHRLVCSAFHGAPEDEALQVRHLNGIKTDNRPENLKWGTAKENGEDKVRLGECAVGEKNAAAMLSECDLVLIRTLLPRCTNKTIAQIIGTTSGNINRIRKGEAWQHARQDLPDLLAALAHAEQRAEQAERERDAWRERVDGAIGYGWITTDEGVEIASVDELDAQLTFALIPARAAAPAGEE